MTRHVRLALVVFAVMAIASGCVSTGTFEKMQADKDGEIAALQKEKAALSSQKSKLEQESAALSAQKSKLEQEKAALSSQKGTLEQDNAALKQQIDALAQRNKEMEQQKAAMAATGQEQQKQYDALVKGLSKEVEKGQLQVKQYKNMLAVDLAEQIFFDSGKATVKAGGKEVLTKVANALKGYDDKVIWVVGHTDNVQIAKALQATFPTNWELSVARATNVVRALQDAGIPPERMMSSGRGEHDPVAPNDTPEGRQKNRRIEIMVIDKNLLGEITRPRN
jgi:chemotaxis protein MotB